jgi:hypothetical protein
LETIRTNSFVIINNILAISGDPYDFYCDGCCTGRLQFAGCLVLFEDPGVRKGKSADQRSDREQQKSAEGLHSTDHTQLAFTGRSEIWHVVVILPDFLLPVYTQTERQLGKHLSYIS